MRRQLKSLTEGDLGTGGAYPCSKAEGQRRKDGAEQQNGLCGVRVSFVVYPSHRGVGWTGCHTFVGRIVTF